jgi:hypothetical protein
MKKKYKYLLKNPNITWNIIQMNSELCSHDNFKWISKYTKLSWYKIYNNLQYPWNWEQFSRNTSLLGMDNIYYGFDANFDYYSSEVPELVPP